MTIISAVKRSSDGLLADIQQSPHMPADPQRRIQNAINQFGGGAQDWAVVQIPPALWSGVNPMARQFAQMSGGQISAITQSTPPQISSDVTQIENDGIDAAALSADVGDPSYEGEITWTVYSPDGSAQSQSESMSAGLASLTLTTTQEGAHDVMASTPLHGVANITVEGI